MLRARGLTLLAVGGGLGLLDAPFVSAGGFEECRGGDAGDSVLRREGQSAEGAASGGTSWVRNRTSVQVIFDLRVEPFWGWNGTGEHKCICGIPCSSIRRLLPSLEEHFGLISAFPFTVAHHFPTLFPSI